MSAALDLLAGLVLEDGRRWGDAAAPFQWVDAEAILDEGSATPYSFLTRSRGGAKTADLAAMSLVAMLAQLPSGSRMFGVAADLAQGGLLVESIDGFARRTPELRGAITVNAYKVVSVRSGSVLEVLPADGAGAWGLRPRWLVADELGQWPSTPGARTLWEAVTSAAAKVPGCRMTVLTTAADPAHWSRRVLDHALGDPLWRVHEVPGPAPWLDPGRVAEQRRRLPDSIFRRLFENQWVSGEDRLVSAEDLAACVTLDGPLEPVSGMGYAIGVDIGLKRDATVAIVAHLEGGVVFLDRSAVWQGSRLRPVRLGEVEEWLAKAATEYRANVSIDPWQAAQLVERLRRRGVWIDEFPFSAQSVGRLASTLLLLLRDRALRLPDDPDLLEELANVRLRETSPGVLRMDHDAGRHDDRAIALALACHRLVARGEWGPPARTFVARSRIPTGPPRRTDRGMSLQQLSVALTGRGVEPAPPPGIVVDP